MYFNLLLVIILLLGKINVLIFFNNFKCLFSHLVLFTKHNILILFNNFSLIYLLTHKKLYNITLSYSIILPINSKLSIK